MCDGKKLRFIKKQEASELLSNLKIRTPLTKLPMIWLINTIMHLKEKSK